MAERAGDDVIREVVRTAIGAEIYESQHMIRGYDSAARAVLDALRKLPVEQRMEAMGITPVQAWDAFGAALSKTKFVKIPTPEDD